MTRHNERRRGFLTRPRTRFHLAMTIWVSLILVAFVLYVRRHGGPDLTLSRSETVTYIVVVAGLTIFAMGLTYFAWLLYVPTLARDEEGAMAPIKLLAGAATLVPPCIIGYSLLSSGFTIAPWFALLFAVLGMFALLTPHQEYLFTAQTRRAALQDVRWSTVEPRPRIRRDFSVFDYEPTTVGSSYARAVAQLDELDARTSPRESRRPLTEAPTSLPPISPIEPIARTPVPTPRKAAPDQRRPSGLDKLVGAAAVEEPKAQVVAPLKPAARTPVAEPLQPPTHTVQPTPEVPTDPVEEKPEPGLRRYTDAGGVDCIEGVVEAVFQPGQKRTYAHVAFDPPFDGSPEVVCDVIDTDLDVRLRTPQTFPYGARLELTRKDNIKSREAVHVGLLARRGP